MGGWCHGREKFHEPQLSKYKVCGPGGCWVFHPWNTQAQVCNQSDWLRYLGRQETAWISNVDNGNAAWKCPSFVKSAKALLRDKKEKANRELNIVFEKPLSSPHEIHSLGDLFNEAGWLYQPGQMPGRK